MVRCKSFVVVLLLIFAMISGLWVHGLADANIFKVSSDLHEITASDGDTNDRFGGSIAIDGDTAIIGATNANSAYLFKRWIDGSWSEITRLSVKETINPTWFGYTVDISGDTAVVGTNNTKVAYVFESDAGDPGSWNQVKKISTDGGPQDGDGFDVAIDQNTIVIGYPEGETAYVHERDNDGPGNWGRVKQLSTGEVGVWNFGGAVDISEDVIAVVAEELSGPIVVYLFQRDAGGPGNWGQIKKVSLDDDDGEEDVFEASKILALENNTMVVGAYDATIITSDGLHEGQGAAYIFEQDEGGTDNWGRVKKLTASDGAAYEWFGYSVGISGDKAIIGAVWADLGSNDRQGAAYIFQRDAGGSDNWGEVEKLSAADGAERDYFGASVAVSNLAEMFGAPGADLDIGENQGKAYHTKGKLPEYQNYLPLLK